MSFRSRRPRRPPRASSSRERGASRSTTTTSAVGEQPSPADGQQTLVTRTATHQVNGADAVAGSRASRPDRQLAGVERRRDGVANGAGTAGVTAARHSDQDAVGGPGDGGSPGGRGRCVVGAHAPDARRVGFSGDGVVGRAVTRGGVHEPGTRDVGVDVLPRVPCDRTIGHERGQLLAQPRRHDLDHRTRSDERPRRVARRPAHRRRRGRGGRPRPGRAGSPVSSCRQP